MLTSLDRQCVNASKTLLSESFDESLTSIFTAYTYYLLGCYFLLEDNSLTAMFYLTNAKAFIDYWNSNPHSQDPEDVLEQIRVSYLEGHLLGVFHQVVTPKDLLKHTKLGLYMHCIVRQYHLTYCQVHNMRPNDSIHSELDELLPLINLIKQDIDNDTDVSFPVTVPMIDHVINKIQKPAAYSGNAMDLYQHIKRKNLLLVMLSTKISLLLQQGHKSDSLIRGVADDISNNADTVSLSLWHTTYASSILFAMQVHMDCLRKSSDSIDRGMILFHLKKEINLLREMMKTSKRFELEFMNSVSIIEGNIVDAESSFKCDDLCMFIESTMKEFFDCK
jgi:hypothetical protein